MSDVLLITGGSRGIGAAIVRAAAARGYRVAFSYRRERARAEELIAALGAEHAAAFEGDVADPAFPAGFWAFAADRFGPVTALVNNAGVTGRLGPLRELTSEDLERTVAVNLTGTIRMAQQAVRQWEAAGIAGRMVNLSSVAASLGAPGEYVHYAATKAGVEAFTVGLAKEVAAAGIRVNAVAPGTVYTEIHAAAGEPERPARVVSRVPMGRIGEPAEIAEAVLWLLSPAASYVTGAVLRASGGL